MSVSQLHKGRKKKYFDVFNSENDAVKDMETTCLFHLPKCQIFYARAFVLSTAHNKRVMKKRLLAFGILSECYYFLTNLFPLSKLALTMFIVPVVLWVPHCVFDVVIPYQDSSQKERIVGQYCTPEQATGGAAVGDYDGDGMEDIYFTVFDGRSVLYKNNGKFNLST